MVDKDEHAENKSFTGVETWAFTLSLSQGDEIYINDRDRAVTVTDVRPNANDGATTEITLDGNGTTYKLRVSNHSPSDPLLTYPSADQSEPVIRIKPSNETILTDTHALDILREHPQLNTSLSSPPPNLKVDEFEHIGTCPVCDCSVVKQDERAVCTECGAWSYLTEWKAYHEK